MRKCLSKIGRDIGIAGVTAITLFVATALWVKINFTLDSVAAHSYYHATLLNGLRPRALTGTLVYFMGLSPSEFILLLQVFKFLWLWLLSFQIINAVHDRRSALLLCFLFAVNSDIYICNAMGGFIDMAANFWLLLGASLLHNNGAGARWRMVFGVIALYCALLTHEIALFGITLLILWHLLFSGREALRWAVPLALLCGHYLWVIWTKLTYGGTSQSYAEILMHFHITLPGVNLMGLVTAAGMLWVIYAMVSYAPLHGPLRKRYAVFTIVACIVSLLPVIMGADTQRMAGMVIWLPIYLLVIDQAGLWKPDSLPRRILPVLCVLQLLIPPSFIYARMAVALNCYAVDTLAMALPHDKGNLLLPVYLHGPERCERN